MDKKKLQSEIQRLEKENKVLRGRLGTAQSPTKAQFPPTGGVPQEATPTKREVSPLLEAQSELTVDEIEEMTKFRSDIERCFTAVSAMQSAQQQQQQQSRYRAQAATAGLGAAAAATMMTFSCCEDILRAHDKVLALRDVSHTLDSTIDKTKNSVSEMKAAFSDLCFVDD